MESLYSFTCRRSFQVSLFLLSPNGLVPLLLSSEFLFHKLTRWFTSDEWTNFLERVKCGSEEELRAREELEEELRLWASYRGQTLTKTGMWLFISFLKETLCFTF